VETTHAGSRAARGRTWTHLPVAATHHGARGTHWGHEARGGSAHWEHQCGCRRLPQKAPGVRVLGEQHPVHLIPEPRMTACAEQQRASLRPGGRPMPAPFAARRAAAAVLMSSSYGVTQPLTDVATACAVHCSSLAVSKAVPACISGTQVNATRGQVSGRHAYTCMQFGSPVT